MFISADKLHDGKRFLPKGSVLELADDGTVEVIHENFVGDTIHYDGTICPAFINAHCHLELSHLKGFIPKHTGLISFLLQVMKGRAGFAEEEKTSARTAAYDELYANGVIAVGDIANTTDTLDVRNSQKLRVHTFVESLGFNPTFAEKSFEYAFNTYKAFIQPSNTSTHTQSITAHAPYSVSEKLFGLIDAFETNSLLSIHNQECEAEDQFYKDKSGAMNELFEGLNIDSSSFSPSGKSSLQTYGTWISSEHPVLFVHNSFTKKEDLDFVLQRFPKSFFCLCPNANLYIENTLPDVKMMQEAGATICIGTDSLASNDTLCIYTELKTLHEKLEIDWETLLTWGIYNGAKALQMDNKIGSFEIGKKPGVMQLLKDGNVRRVL